MSLNHTNTLRRMTALAVLSILSMDVTAADAGKGTRVKSAAPTRVFVMAGFAADCTFKGFPDMQVTVAPTKGQVSFKTGDPATHSVQSERQVRRDKRPRHRHLLHVSARPKRRR